MGLRVVLLSTCLVLCTACDIVEQLLSDSSVAFRISNQTRYDPLEVTRQIEGETTVLALPTGESRTFKVYGDWRSDDDASGYEFPSVDLSASYQLAFGSRQARLYQQQVTIEVDCSGSVCDDGAVRFLIDGIEVDN